MDRSIIAVIGGSSGEALTEALHKRGYQVVLIAGRVGEPGTATADHVIVADLTRQEEILCALEQLEVRYIVVGTGHIFALQLAQYLERHGMCISLDMEASLLAKDKVAYKALLEKEGFLTPRSLVAKSVSLGFADNVKRLVGYPCVVKSAVDRVEPEKVHNEEELLLAAREVEKTQSDLLIEEFVEGIDCTIPVVANYDRAKSILFSYYNKAASYKLKGFSHTQAGESLSQTKIEEIMAVAEAVVRQTGVKGLCRVDIIVDARGRVVILECNSVIITGYTPIGYMSYALKQQPDLDFADLLIENSLSMFRRQEQNTILLHTP